MKLASGFAPTENYLQAGINLAVGTDGAASNNDLDMFVELRSMSFTTKASSKIPTLLPAKEALKIATLGGAKALGLDHKIGSLERVCRDARERFTPSLVQIDSHCATAN